MPKRKPRREVQQEENVRRGAVGHVEQEEQGDRGSRADKTRK